VPVAEGPVQARGGMGPPVGVNLVNHLFSDAYDAFHRVKRAASEIHCSVLAAGKPTWKKYWFLKRSVAECANRVKIIRTAVQVGSYIQYDPRKLMQHLQLVLESEIQRRLTEDIKETRSIITNTWSACAGRRVIKLCCIV
jgi:hypothetical protein